MLPMEMMMTKKEHTLMNEPAQVFLPAMDTTDGHSETG